MVVGAGAAGIADGALAAGLDPARVTRVRDADAAVEVVVPRLRDDDVVLLKASRGIALERVVAELRRELGDEPAR